MAAASSTISLSDLSIKAISLIARYLLEKDDSFHKFSSQASDIESVFQSHKVDGKWFEIHSKPQFAKQLTPDIKRGLASKLYTAFKKITSEQIDEILKESGHSETKSNEVVSDDSKPKPAVNGHHQLADSTQLKEDGFVFMNNKSSSKSSGPLKEEDNGDDHKAVVLETESKDQSHDKANDDAKDKKSSGILSAKEIGEIAISDFHHTARKMVVSLNDMMQKHKVTGSTMMDHLQQSPTKSDLQTFLKNKVFRWTVR